MCRTLHLAWLSCPHSPAGDWELLNQHLRKGKCTRSSDANEHPALLSATFCACIHAARISGGCHKMPSLPQGLHKAPDKELFSGCPTHTPAALSSVVMPPHISSSPLCQEHFWEFHSEAAPRCSAVFAWQTASSRNGQNTLGLLAVHRAIPQAKKKIS